MKSHDNDPELVQSASSQILDFRIGNSQEVSSNILVQTRRHRHSNSTSWPSMSLTLHYLQINPVYKQLQSTFNVMKFLTLLTSPFWGPKIVMKTSFQNTCNFFHPSNNRPCFAPIHNKWNKFPLINTDIST